MSCTCSDIQSRIVPNGGERVSVFGGEAVLAMLIHTVPQTPSGAFGVLVAAVAHNAGSHMARPLPGRPERACRDADKSRVGWS